MMQCLVMQEPAEMMPTKIYLIQIEVKALYNAVLELLPDVEMFQNEINSAKSFLSITSDYQDSVLEQMLNKLKMGNSKISQVKMKVASMRSDVNMLLTRSSIGIEENTTGSLTALVKVENSVAPGDEQSGAEIVQLARPAQDIMQQASELFYHDDEDEVETTQQSEPSNDQLSTSQSTHSPTNKCRICGEKIHSRYYHMRKYHPGQKFFPCNICKEGFDDFKEFQNHTKAHKGSPLLKCDLCNRVLTTRPGMVEHLKSHKGDKPYTCTVCGKSYRFRNSLSKCTHGQVSARVSNYMKYQSGFQCRTCRQHFASVEAIDKSRYEQSSLGGDFLAIAKVDVGKLPCKHSDIRKMFYCNFCSKSYNAARKLRYHMNIHFGIKLYKCESCGENFFTSTEKKKHIHEKHGGEFPGYKCRVCGIMCRSILGRESHYLSHSSEERSEHNVVIKMAECDICGKTVRRNELPNHKLVHASQDSFICEVCGKGFRRKASLKYHVRVHMNPEDRPVVRRRFTQPGHRRRETQPRQKRVAETDKIFKCDICSKYLSSRQSLQQHELVHTKVKAYKCNLCGLSFTLPGNLRRHYIIHSGQKPFQCDFCGKGFVQKTCLDIHRRVHTGEKPYQCNHCGKRFSDPSTLYKHKAKHEKDVTWCAL